VFSRAMGPSTEIENLAIGALHDANQYTEVTLLNGLVRSRIAAGDADGVFRFLSMFNLVSEDLLYLPPGLTMNSSSSYRPSPNAHTYVMLLRFFLKRRQLHHFDLAFMALLSRKFPLDIGTVALMIRSAAMKGKFCLAGSILQILCRRTPRAISKLACIAGPGSDIPNRLSQDIQSLSPNAQVFNALLEEWLPKHGLGHVKSILLAMEIAIGGPDLKTMNIFVRYMFRFRGVQPTYVLRFLCNATRLWPIPFTNIVYEAILSSALRAEIGRIKGYAVSRSTRDINQLSHLLVTCHDGQIFNVGSLRLPYAEKRYLTFLLDSLKQRGVRLSLAGFALKIRYQALIQMDMAAAERTLSEMRSQGMEANHFHYGALVEGYVNTGQMEAALRIAQGFSRQTKAEVLYTIIIHGFARQGQPQKAQGVFEDMVRGGARPDWAAVDAVVCAWHRNGRSAIAGEKLIELWPFVSNTKSLLAFGSSFPQLLQEFRRQRYLHEPHFAELNVTRARFGTLMRRKYGSMLLHIVTSRAHPL